MDKRFFAIKQRVIFTSLPLFPSIKKDVLPALLLSNVVYNFLCHCNSRYVGCTSQRIQDRIPQHVTKCNKTDQIPNFRNISTRFGKPSTPVLFSESAIVQNLLDNPIPANNAMQGPCGPCIALLAGYVHQKLQ